MINSNKKSSKTIAIIAIIASLAGLLFGFDTGIISGALLFIEKDFHASVWVQEIIVGSVLVGAIIGSSGSGKLADKLGRRIMLLYISSIFVFGTFLSALAPNVEILLIGRFFIGLAIGMGSYTAPLYIAESAPQHKRGELVSLNQLMITVGIMCSYFISYSFSGTVGAWRWMFAIGLVPASMLGIGFLFLPESPRWLVKQNRRQEAAKILSFLRGASNVDAELDSITNSLQERQAKFKDLFSAWARPVLFLGVALAFFQQTTGINAIIYYSPRVFQMAGFYDASSSILATAGVGVLNVLSTIFAIKVVDRLGRRPLMFIGLTGMGASLFIISYVFHDPSNTSVLRWATVGSVFSYIVCFAFSMGALMWLMLSEIFPLEIRGVAMSLAVASCWFFNLSVSTTFLTLVKMIGISNTFSLYGAMCVIGLVFGYLFVPETKGVSLEEIEKNIRKRLPLREIGQSVGANTRLDPVREIKPL